MNEGSVLILSAGSGQIVKAIDIEGGFHVQGNDGWSCATILRWLYDLADERDLAGRI